jgi:hypothetical protein
MSSLTYNYMKIVPSEKYVFFIFFTFYLYAHREYSASPNANIPGGYRTDTRINEAKKWVTVEEKLYFRNTKRALTALLKIKRDMVAHCNAPGCYPLIPGIESVVSRGHGGLNPLDGLLPWMDEMWQRRSKYTN